MIHLMQQVLGDDWSLLPPVLQQHHSPENRRDTGVLSVDYPGLMQPYLNLLTVFGALVNRRGSDLPTLVERHAESDRQYLCRRLVYADGRARSFNSFWIYAGEHQLIEFVNSLLGLHMRVQVEEGKLVFQGIKFVVKLGSWLLPVPEWLVLGHTRIVEQAIDDSHFAMDFSLRHPLFGQVFRYSGIFEPKV